MTYFNEIQDLIPAYPLIRIGYRIVKQRHGRRTRVFYKQTVYANGRIKETRLKKKPRQT
jgi:hypothetical protein